MIGVMSVLALAAKASRRKENWRRVAAVSPALGWRSGNGASGGGAKRRKHAWLAARRKCEIITVQALYERTGVA